MEYINTSKLLLYSTICGEGCVFQKMNHDSSPVSKTRLIFDVNYFAPLQ